VARYYGKEIAGQARNDFAENGFRVKPGMTVGGKGFRVKHGMTMLRSHPEPRFHRDRLVSGSNL